LKTTLPLPLALLSEMNSNHLQFIFHDLRFNSVEIMISAK
jgi:hypothetical protein